MAEEEDKDSKTEPATPDKINKAFQKVKFPLAEKLVASS